jgi:hypothetical protein
MEEKTDHRLIILAVFALIAVGVVAAILISRGGDSDSDSTTAASGTDGCKQVEAPQPKKVTLEAPKQTVKAGEELTAVVATSCGTSRSRSTPNGRRRRPTRSPTWPKRASTTTSASTGSFRNS